MNAAGTPAPRQRAEVMFQHHVVHTLQDLLVVLKVRVLRLAEDESHCAPVATKCKQVLIALRRRCLAIDGSYGVIQRNVYSLDGIRPLYRAGHRRTGELPPPTVQPVAGRPS